MPKHPKEFSNKVLPYAPKPRGKYAKSGLYGLKRVLKKVGISAIDARSAGGQQILGERRQWIADCGGVENLTSMELTIINSATVTNLLLGVVDSWVIEHQNPADPQTGFGPDHHPTAAVGKFPEPVPVDDRTA